MSLQNIKDASNKFISMLANKSMTFIENIHVQNLGIGLIAAVIGLLCSPIAVKYYGITSMWQALASAFFMPVMACISSIFLLSEAKLLYKMLIEAPIEKLSAKRPIKENLKTLGKSLLADITTKRNLLLAKKEIKDFSYNIPYSVFAALILLGVYSFILAGSALVSALFAILTNIASSFTNIGLLNWTFLSAFVGTTFAFRSNIKNMLNNFRRSCENYELLVFPQNRASISNEELKDAGKGQHLFYIGTALIATLATVIFSPIGLNFLNIAYNGRAIFSILIMPILSCIAVLSTIRELQLLKNIFVLPAIGIFKPSMPIKKYFSEWGKKINNPEHLAHNGKDDEIIVESLVFIFALSIVGSGYYALTYGTAAFITLCTSGNMLLLASISASIFTALSAFAGVRTKYQHTQNILGVATCALFTTTVFSYSSALLSSLITPPIICLSCFFAQQELKLLGKTFIGSVPVENRKSITGFMTAWWRSIQATKTKLGYFAEDADKLLKMAKYSLIYSAIPAILLAITPYIPIIAMTYKSIISAVGLTQLSFNAIVLSASILGFAIPTITKLTISAVKSLITHFKSDRDSSIIGDRLSSTHSSKWKEPYKPPAPRQQARTYSSHALLTPRMSASLRVSGW